MPDLTEQISSLLSDPEGMEKIKAMAEGLFAEQNIPVQKPEEPAGVDLAAIGKMMSMLKPPANDSRVELLYALKPHLSREKQQRVDKAVKMLRLLQLTPMLSQMGIFEL